VEEDPWTFAAMMAGTLAITGVGLEEIGGFAGFYSKDAIIEAAYAKGTGLGHFAAWMGIIAALLTSFYSWRLVFLTFFGKPRWNQSEHIQHALHDSHGHGHEDHAHGHDHHGHGHKHDDDGTAGYHPHESPLVMMIPLAILSFGAVFAGAIFHHAFTGIEGAPEFWRGALVFNKELAEAAEHIPELIKLAPFIVMVLGLVTAWVCYLKVPSIPAAFVRTFKPLHTFVYNKWFFDELYNFLFVRTAFALGKLFWKVGDIGIIDRFGPNGAAWVVAKGSIEARKVQSGFLTSYALWMLVGLVAAVTWVWFH
jgi:NADH-quinone oxidoreductase subunit L